MRGNNPLKKIYVAGAGTGKTSMLRNIALERRMHQRVLYLTYTDANAAEFKFSVISRVGHMPANITVMTWFSFLLTHGVRPFPAKGFTHRINKIMFNNEEPRNIRGTTRESEKYYCPGPGIVYRTRLSSLAVLCNEQWGGEVIRRICAIYATILVDEAQDFAGYDYDFLLSLMNESQEMVIVGDPRQQTYRTGAKAKNRNNPNVFDFFKKKSPYVIDDTTLSVTHRCSKEVISLANRLYPELPSVKPSAKRLLNPRGALRRIAKTEFEELSLSTNKTITALIWDSRTKVPASCRVMTMGESKGLTLGDVAIFPTKDMRLWFEGKPVNLNDGARAKLYVAITRASGDLFFVL